MTDDDKQHEYVPPALADVGNVREQLGAMTAERDGYRNRWQMLERDIEPLRALANRVPILEENVTRLATERDKWERRAKERESERNAARQWARAWKASAKQLRAECAAWRGKYDAMLVEFVSMRADRNWALDDRDALRARREVRGRARAVATNARG